MSVLNYACGLVLFRKGLKFAWAPSALASFLVAFGAPRVNQIGHPQLIPCFFVLITVFALVRLFAGNPQRPWERLGLWLLAMLGSVLQFYCGFYLAWFLMIGIGFSAAAAVLLPPCRAPFFEVVRRDLAMIMAAGLGGMLLLLPLVSHYLPSARYVGARQYLPMYYAYNPYPCSWFHVGRGHWLWGWTASRDPFRSLGHPPEHFLGFGFLTQLACAAGLYLGRERPICRLAAAVTLALILATTFLPGQEIVLLGTGAGAYCLACLYREFNAPRERVQGLAALLGLLVLVRFPNPALQVLIYCAMVICSLELVRARRCPEHQVLPGITLMLCCLKMFALNVLTIGFCLAGAVALPLGLFWVGRRRQIALAAILVAIGFSAAMTTMDQPIVYLGTAAAVLIALLISTPSELRIPAWLVPRLDRLHGAAPVLL